MFNIAERSFGLRLLEMGKIGSPILVMRLYLLNGRGGPWFSQLAADSIEDVKFVPLHVQMVDISNRTLQLGTELLSVKPKNGRLHRCPSRETMSAVPVVLNRRTALERMQWCIKGSLAWFSPDKHDGFSRAIPKSMFTLASPEYNLINDIRSSRSRSASVSTVTSLRSTVSSITNFDMQLHFLADEQLPSPHTTATHIQIIQLNVSWSVLFAAYCEEHGIDAQGIQSISVHDPVKCQLLLDECKFFGLTFKQTFWSFDVVLHWLTHGEKDDVRTVVSFLETHTSLHSRTKASPSKRYYVSETAWDEAE
jgi:hypothetical protein